MICLLLAIASCRISYPEFGKSKIVKHAADTLATKQRKAEIRSIDNRLFETGSSKGTTQTVLQYRLLKPENKQKKQPLVIVFHGSDAIGNNNSSQLSILAKLWALPAISAKYPAYVLAPQFPSRSSNYVMDKDRNVLTSVPQANLQTALQLIDSLKTVLNIDTQKIYAIGFSMGGSSVINALSARPDLFAAGVSISGIPQFEQLSKLRSTPIWLMHGNLDTENPYNSDERFYKELNTTHNRARFWEFDQVEHNDIFSTLILGDNIPKWLFQHKKMK